MLSFVFKPIIQGFLGAVGVALAGAIVGLFIITTPVGDIIVDVAVKSIVESSVAVGMVVEFDQEFKDAILRLIELLGK